MRTDIDCLNLDVLYQIRYKTPLLLVIKSQTLGQCTIDLNNAMHFVLIDFTFPLIIAAVRTPTTLTSLQP